MFLFVFGAIIAVAGLVFLVARPKYKQYNTDHYISWGVIAGAILLPLAIVLMFFSTLNVVGARKVGVPVTFGHIGADLQPGVHFLAPWTQVQSCPLSQQQAILSQNPTEGDQQGNDGININGSDNGSGIASVSVLYHFSPDHANLLYRKYACNPDVIKSNLIRAVLKNAIRRAAVLYAATDVRAHTADLGVTAEKDMSPILEGDGILVDNVIVADIQLSVQTQQAADNKLAAVQQQQTTIVHLAQAQTELQITQTQANATKIANDAKNASLTPAILCEDWINAIAKASPSVVSTAGPCGAFSAVGQNVIVQVPTGKAA